MKLNKLHIRKREPSSRDHASTIASASMSGSACLVSPSVAASSKDRIECADSVNGAISNAHDGHASAGALIVHDQV